MTPLVALHVPAEPINPYNRLIGEALAPFGVHADLWVIPRGSRNPRRLLPRLREADLVHWHWTQGLYQGRRPATFMLRSLRFTSMLDDLRRRRIPQVVTVHNLLPHEHAYAALHRRMYRAIGQRVDRILVHHADAVPEVNTLYRQPEKIRIVPMVDYGDRSPPASREGLRTKWNLTEQPHWAILFGAVRPYKGVEVALRAARQFAEQGIGLLVAGPCPDPAYRRALEALNPHHHARLCFRTLEDAELSELLFACDVTLMLYRPESLTSSAVQLAFSHELPVVATNALAFRALLRTGLVQACNPDDQEDLVNAALRAVQMRNPAWRQAVRDHRRTCTPEVVGRALSGVYAELCPELHAWQAEHLAG